MSKGGSPMGGGFGGQQQQGGFGGGFGGQRFNQMPQQQQGGFGGQQGGFGNTFARTMPPQQGFGGGFDPGGIRSTPVRPPRQQGFGGGIGSFLGGQGFNMPQRHAGEMPRSPQQDFSQSQAAAQQPNADASRAFEEFQAAQRMGQGQPGFGGSQSVGPQVSPIPPLLQQDPGGFPLEGQRFSQSKAASQAPMDSQSILQMGNMLRGMGGGSQPVLGTPGGNLVGGMDPRVLRPNVNRPLPQQQMPPNPYAQQVRQEDPRMQAMRMMQRMNFGGGGGYNF